MLITILARVFRNHLKPSRVRDAKGRVVTQKGGSPQSGNGLISLWRWCHIIRHPLSSRRTQRNWIRFLDCRRSPIRAISKHPFYIFRSVELEGRRQYARNWVDGWIAVTPPDRQGRGEEDADTTERKRSGGGQMEGGEGTGIGRAQGWESIVERFARWLVHGAVSFRPHVYASRGRKQRVKREGEDRRADGGWVPGFSDNWMSRCCITAGFHAASTLPCPAPPCFAVHTGICKSARAWCCRGPASRKNAGASRTGRH